MAQPGLTAMRLRCNSASIGDAGGAQLQEEGGLELRVRGQGAEGLEGDVATHEPGNSRL